MKNKMGNGNNLQSSNQGRMFNLIVEQPNLKWKSNLTIVLNRGFIRWIEDRICKGPPGWSRSPGIGDGLFPDHPPDEFFTPGRGGDETRPAVDTNSYFCQRSLSLSKGNTVHTEYQNINANTDFTNIKFLLT